MALALEKDLQLTYPLSLEALDDRLAIVGTAGSGKTYLAQTAIEHIMRQEHRVIISDPLGVWYGLREKGFVETSGQRVTVTQSGEAALPEYYEPLPTGIALQDYWRSKLPEGERKILNIVLQSYPNGITRDDISIGTDYKRSSRDAYLQRMKAKRVVEIDGSIVRPSQLFFEALSS